MKSQQGHNYRGLTVHVCVITLNKWCVDFSDSTQSRHNRSTEWCHLVAIYLLILLQYTLA